MNSYEKAQAVGLIGTDQEIVSTLQLLTSTDLSTTALEQFLFDNNLMIYTGDRFIGPMQEILNGLHEDHPIAHAIHRMKAAVYTKVASVIRSSTDKNVASEMFLLVAKMAEDTKNNSLGDIFYPLVGGCPYKNLTVEEFLVDKQQFETEVEAESQRLNCESLFAHVMNTYVNPVTHNKVLLIQALKDAASYLEIN